MRRTPFDARPTRDRPDDDPSRWLENVDGSAALAWVEAGDAETLACYGDETYTRDRDIARGLLDRPDRIPVVSRYGKRLYNFWRDAEHPWRVAADRGTSGEQGAGGREGIRPHVNAMHTRKDLPRDGTSRGLFGSRGSMIDPVKSVGSQRRGVLIKVLPGTLKHPTRPAATSS